MVPPRVHFLKICIAASALIFLWGVRGFGQASEHITSSDTVYVSVYSNIYYGARGRPFQLAATLSIRNTDPKYPISIVSAEYYDSEGNKIRDFMEKPLELKPLASTYFYVKEADTQGGSGANFIVRWNARHKVNHPIIETVMTGVESGQGISFICPGVSITEHK